MRAGVNAREEQVQGYCVAFSRHVREGCPLSGGNISGNGRIVSVAARLALR
jgi:hypothetical protein